jgi:two-component system, NarL family, response regulator YdfI
MGLIRIGIVAPVPAVRAGLQAMLAADPALVLLSVTASLEEILPPELTPDVLILASGLEADFSGSVEKLPETAAVLWMPAVWDGTEMHGLSERVVWGILPQDVSQEELAAAVHALGEGLMAGSPALLRTLLAAAPESRPAVFEPENSPLTGREMEVLQLLSQGLANKQIAEVLEISIHTVKYHISSIYERLGATNRAEAVRLGLQRGILSL